MGKQSRRKGRKGDRKAHKERRQDRRGHVEDDQGFPRERGDGGDGDGVDSEERPFFVGDRVFFYDTRSNGEDPDTYRGIVQRVEASTLDILPFRSRKDGENCSWTVPLDRVFYDWWDLTLRFGVGDTVLCSGGDWWLPATVEYVFPIYELKNMPRHVEDTMAFYKCTVHPPDGRTFQVCCPSDTEACIMKRPSIFRLSKGDTVTFNAEKAERLPLRFQKYSWITATISGVDIVDPPHYYAVYECTFSEKGQTHVCYILSDVDENVANVRANPRDRLMEAIEQDCTAEHIDYLTKTFDIDVSTFQDLVLKKAIEFGNYGALMWLQTNLSVDLDAIRDGKGNTLLGQIAASPHASRFLRRAAEIDFLGFNSRPDAYIKLDTNWNGLSLIEAASKGEETWLHTLVRNRDTYALSCALSPNTGLAWTLAWAYRKKENDPTTSLLDTVRKSKEFEMEIVIEEFISFRTTSLQETRLGNLFRGRGDTVLRDECMVAFHGDEAELCARRFIRFCIDWQSRHPSMNRSLGDHVMTFAENGFHYLLRLLIENYGNLLNSPPVTRTSLTDRGEYVQPELFGFEQDDNDDCYDEFNLVSIAVLGIGDALPPSRDCVEKGGRKYLDNLRYHAVNCAEKHSWLAHMQDAGGTTDDLYCRELKRYKVSLLVDNDSLDGRLKVLEYIVQGKKCPPPNPLDALRFRQCGVLRWMVEVSILDLLAEAFTEKSFVQDEKQLLFLGKERIPRSITVGAFLCFAAVEFDDLQSLQWLVGKRNISIDVLAVGGWNIVHVAAYFGRSEILVWLHQQTSWPSLIEQVSCRKSWENMRAVHIAVKRGFTSAADLLLLFGCLSFDTSGKSVDYYARKSSHEYVRKWGNEKAKPLVLEKNIQKLLRLLRCKNSSHKDAKVHIATSKCMDIETWSNCGYDRFDEPGPLGKTFLSILTECCRSDDHAFVIWLCNEISRPGKLNQYFFVSFWGQLDWFFGGGRKGRKLDTATLIRVTGDDSLDPWIPKIFQGERLEFLDPNDAFPFIRRLTDVLPSKELLVNIQQELLKVDILRKMVEFGQQDVRRQLERGFSPDETTDAICAAAAKLGQEEEREIEFYFSELDLVLPDGCVNMDTVVFVSDFAKQHPVHKMMLFRNETPIDFSKIHRVLAIENYHSLIRWCLRRAHPWSAVKEVEMARIAAFFGHSKTLDIFLNNSVDHKFLSSTEDRFHAAMLGAAESGRAIDLMGYMSMYDPPEDVVTSGEIQRWNDDTTGLLESSLSMVAVVGCLQGSAEPEAFGLHGSLDRGHALFQTLVRTQEYQAEVLLHAAQLFLDVTFDVSCWERFLSFFRFLCQELDLDVWRVEELVTSINQRMILRMRSFGNRETEEKEKLLHVASEWLALVEKFGLDIQTLQYDIYVHHKKDDEFSSLLASIKEKQLRTWAQFDVLKHGQQLLGIQQAVEKGHLRLSARDRGGLLLTHLAAAYDRVDVLEWIVDVQGMDLDAVDGQGRHVLQVAEASKAVLAIRWIRERQARLDISSFLSTHFRRRLALKRKHKMQKAVTKLQARQRGKIVKQKFRGIILERVEDSQRFHTIWRCSMEMLPLVLSTASTWGSIREQFDMRSADGSDLDCMSDTVRMLESATLSALSEAGEDADLMNDHGVPSCQNGKESVHPTSNDMGSDRDDDVQSSLPHCARIQLTSDVVRWLRQGDPKYREFFVRRMQQLAAGERSRILAKRLKGSKCAVFETYLEQKSGYRILWTEGPAGDLLIWNVAKHKSVSRLMRLVADSERRSARQRVSVSVLPEFENAETTGFEPSAEEASIRLDPLGNVPLKVYDVPYDEIQEIATEAWSPRLHLTVEERDIVEAEGTVLLLGRSGTGKTICISNRMDYDRQLLSHDPSFSQLFVARSHRLCKYVCDAIGKQPYTSFSTFGQLIESLERLLPKSETEQDLFLPSQKVDFARFKREVYRGDSKGDIDPLLVWTHIRTFIKGSIEAVQNPKWVLSVEDYIPVENLGKKRCRLSSIQRKAVYDVFLRYCKYITELSLWDDCDRINSILRRLEGAKRSDPGAYEAVRQRKVYVDEIQDYTQAECLLFFYLSGPGDLFFAGDPAQSVVEGVEFRFEDIRSVGYHIAGPERRGLIPQKPKIVNVNFRSHSGVLATAGAILRCLLDTFPDSAKQLKEDRGLFRGPRPGVFYKVEPYRLSALVSEKLNGAVILVHDASVSRWKRFLGGYPLVYGIRSAKGLEFKSVILLDFFVELPHSIQKPWRNLLLGRGGDDFNVRNPEVESLLKLLYTAVTRCIEQLFVAESSASVAGDAFVRWLTTTSARGMQSTRQGMQCMESLATRNNVDDVETMVMTSDEWSAAGINNAEMAESAASIDLSQSGSLLDKAIYCFDHARSATLARKARLHRASIRFRIDLRDMEGLPSTDTEVTKLEVEAAMLVKQLLMERLLEEAKELCQACFPYLSAYSRDQLLHSFVAKIEAKEVNVPLNELA